MICSECLERIAELERLERIYRELRKTLRNKAANDALAIQERDAKLDKLICRLELKRHQRHHVTAKPPSPEYPYSANTAAA
jgi:hypothetical protein